MASLPRNESMGYFITTLNTTTKGNDIFLNESIISKVTTQIDTNTASDDVTTQQVAVIDDNDSKNNQPITKMTTPGIMTEANTHTSTKQVAFAKIEDDIKISTNVGTLVNMTKPDIMSQIETNISSGQNISENIKTDQNNGTFSNQNDYTYMYYDNNSIEMLLIDKSIWVTSVPGVIFNSITIVVVSKMRPFSSTSVSMLILGATDLVNVIMRICSAITYALDTVSDITCKLLDYIIILTFNYSNTILVLWTVERFIAVWFPFKWKRYCTVRNTSIALIFAGVSLTLLAFPYPITGFSVMTELGIKVCTYSDFTFYIWTPIESVYYSWIPLVLIFTLNIMIINRLRQQHSDVMKKSSNSTKRAETRTREQRNMTTVLLGVCLAFVLLHLPQAGVIIFYAVQSGQPGLIMADPFGPWQSLQWCFIVTELQNSINFFLYILAGHKFRATAAKLFCRRATSRPETEINPKPKESSTPLSDVNGIEERGTPILHQSEYKHEV